jgi:ParB-like chromosome segregation protein Spo0J
MEYKPMLIKLDQIDASRLVSAGATEFYVHHRLRAGRKFPPLHVRYRVNDGRYTLVDGKNRYWAARREGLTELECELA